MTEIDCHLAHRGTELELRQPERPINRCPQFGFPLTGAEVKQRNRHQPFQCRNLWMLFEKTGRTDRKYLFGEEILSHILRMLFKSQRYCGIESLLIVGVSFS